jgi:hypothetical protein
MKLNEKCFPCLIEQVTETSNLSCTDNEQILKKINMNSSLTKQQIIGQAYQNMVDYIENEDLYHDLKIFYDLIFLNHYELFDKSIVTFQDAVKYAIVGNMIDDNPVHKNLYKDLKQYFNSINELSLKINHIHYLMKDVKKSNSLLYLSDSCGEIVLDKLLIKRIKQLNPKIDIYFGVKGYSVINGCREEDARFISIDDYAKIISNGDSSVGTLLHRTSQEFQNIYNNVDIVISKGQANFECLNESDKNIYFLLTTKCAVVSQFLGVDEQSLVCLNMNYLNQ